MNDVKLLPCPFCGHAEPYFERAGTPRQSCIVACGNCGCRHESSDEGSDSGRQWNTRADATCALRGADEARQFPDNTCPASRHAQMIGEALVKGEAFPQLSDEELPGMWSNSDLSGGETDCVPAHQQEASGAQPIGHVRFVAHRKAPDVEWAANVEIHNGAALYTSPRAAATAPASRDVDLGELSAGGQFDLLGEKPLPAAAPAAPQGMTIAGDGASMLGKLMREQRASRLGVYPDGNPNASVREATAPAGGVTEAMVEAAAEKLCDLEDGCSLSSLTQAEADYMRSIARRTVEAALTTAARAAEPAEEVQRIVHLRTERDRRVYVAGPMTGYPEFNFPLFNETAKRLRAIQTGAFVLALANFLLIVFGMLRHFREVEGDSHRWRELARHDPLTGLSNRKGFTEAALAILSRAQMENAGGAVMMLDLDGFKPINDRYGHAMGDQILVRLADKLASAARATDVVARLGGDEFAILCPKLQGEDIEQFCSRLLTAVASAPADETPGCRLGGSIGIACYPQDGHSLEHLLNLADRAMYAAKNAGGHRWHIA